MREASPGAPTILSQLALGSIQRVTFFKRDELTFDLICCEVAVGEEVWNFHEEMPGWDMLLAHIGNLPGFREDWFAAVSNSAFAPCPIVAFER